MKQASGAGQAPALAAGAEHAAAHPPASGIVQQEDASHATAPGHTIQQPCLREGSSETLDDHKWKPWGASHQPEPQQSCELGRGPDRAYQTQTKRSAEQHTVASEAGTGRQPEDDVAGQHGQGDLAGRAELVHFSGDQPDGLLVNYAAQSPAHIQVEACSNMLTLLSPRSTDIC
jgi:hypothetical protein